MAYPTLVTPQELSALAATERLVIIDTRDADTYAAGLPTSTQATTPTPDTAKLLDVREVGGVVPLHEALGPRPDDQVTRRSKGRMRHRLGLNTAY